MQRPGWEPQEPSHARDPVFFILNESAILFFLWVFGTYFFLCIRTLANEFVGNRAELTVVWKLWARYRVTVGTVIWVTEFDHFHFQPQAVRPASQADDVTGTPLVNTLSSGKFEWARSLTGQSHVQTIPVHVLQWLFEQPLVRRSGLVILGTPVCLN